MMKWSLFFFSFVLAGCSCSGGVNRTDSEPFLDMVQQNPIKPQEGTPEGTLQMISPPEGTRARNRSYYPYSNQPLKAAAELKNPLSVDSEVIKAGEMYYRKFCIYCHGEKGDGQQGATVAPKMAIKPPSLLTDKVKEYSDGRIYHIIYQGQGLMGAYRIQLATDEQVLRNYFKKDGTYRGSKKIWSVVNYIRSLQKLKKEDNE